MTSAVARVYKGVWGQSGLCPQWGPGAFRGKAPGRSRGLGSNISMGLSVTLSDETESQKSKMAAGNNVISRNSANIHDSNEFPTANPTFSGFSISMELLSTLSDVSGSQI
jgi:hypothetical protein